MTQWGIGLTSNFHVGVEMVIYFLTRYKHLFVTIKLLFFMKTKKQFDFQKLAKFAITKVQLKQLKGGDGNGDKDIIIIDEID